MIVKFKQSEFSENYMTYQVNELNVMSKNIFTGEYELHHEISILGLVPANLLEEVDEHNVNSVDVAVVLTNHLTDE